MIRIACLIALPVAAALLMLVGAGRAEAQYVVVTHYQPAPVVYPAPPRVSYYVAPAVSYYPAPTVSYYAAPAVRYYYPPPVAATTRYGLFGRRQYTTYYYPPGYVYP